MPPRRSKEKAASEEITNSQTPLDQEGRKKALESALDDLTKRFGDGAVVRLGDAAHLVVDTIPSGSLTVDIALGVGGMPRGRVVEVYGPESSGKTTLCLHVIAEAQRRGGLAAFVDMEHALDPSYARRLGVNVDTLYVSQPDTAEQALEIMETLVRSGAMDVVVLDSVAALVPRVEIEGEMGESHVGVQARLMSQALRKLSGAIKQSNVCVLFTNQIREKIGVMYGCFSYDAPVMLADGSKRRIGEIVNQRQPLDVMSWNTETHAFEPQPISEWYKEGQPVEQFALSDNAIGQMEREFLTFITSYPDGSGHRRITTTPNHEIATPNGFQLAEDIELGEMVLARHESLCFSQDLSQLLLGSIMGDGSLRKDAEHTAYFREEHPVRQETYLRWKAAAFGELTRSISFNPTRNSISVETHPSTTLAEWKRNFYGIDGRYKRLFPDAIRMLTPFSLAVWYQDDGSRDYQGGRRRNEIAVHRMSEMEGEFVKQEIKSIFGLTSIIRHRPTHTAIIFSGEASDAFERIIAPFVHPSMSHKLRTQQDTAGQRLGDLKFSVTREEAMLPVRVTEIRRRLIRGKRAVRYNLRVANNANYLVSDIIVHNSPETQPGGRALKFYASVRLDVRKLESIKASGDEVIGSRVRVRVTKNKVAPPFREAEFDIMYLEGGISKSGEVLDLATELGIIEKRGAFYRYNDGLLGQGRENAKAYLMENIAIRDEIENRVREQYGLPTIGGAAG